MKVLLIVVALLVAVEAHPGHGWPFYYSGKFEKGSFDRCQRSTYSQQQNQNNILASDVEWVCQNPKTKDMMIIATDNTQRQYPTTGPPHQWQWQNNPPGHQPNHYQHGNQWTQPIIIVQEPTSTNNHQLPPLFPQTTETPNNNNENYNNDNNNNNQPRSTPPPYNGGEGLIDIRVAT